MRRVLAFLDWKSSWWLTRRNSRVDVNKDLVEGLQACAQSQADLQQSLKDHFCALWKSPLTDMGQTAPEDNGEENEPVDGDDDDDDGEEGDGLDVHNNEGGNGGGYKGEGEDEEDPDELA